MQTRKKTCMVLALVGMTMLSVALFSFSIMPGGDHFEVYLNKKLVFQQIVSQPGSLKSLALDQRNANDQVDVFYSHCGKIGTKRIITVRDGKILLKQWKFSDAAGKFMSVSAKEILAFENQKSDRRLNLYYSSEELPEGRLLASVILDTEDHKAMP